MALPLVTAAVALFYAGAIPVNLAFRIMVGGKTGFGAGLSIFVPHAALRRAVMNIERKRKPRSKPKPGKLRKILRLRRHLHPDSIRLSGTVCSGDAAATAMLCGVGIAFIRSLGPNATCDLKPDFSADGLRIELTGMISVRVGHIMLAVLSGLFDYATGRLNPWKDIPLKAS